MDFETIKRSLKRFGVARFVNGRVKRAQTKRQYNRLCAKYHSPSILSDPLAIADLGKRLWTQVSQIQTETDSRKRPRLRVLFVGADWEQDRSGIIQALDSLADVSLFRNQSGGYGQRWPKTAGEVDQVRQENANQLLRQVRALEAQGPVHAIIGQMWGLSMHWRALAKLQACGIAIVNIAMDDRHAFVGNRMTDGTWGGTLGLVPYLNLACTAAPECVRWYEAEGCRAIFLPEASDPEIFQSLNEQKVFDVSFVGANYGIRAQMVQALEEAGIHVQAYGTGWPNGRLPTEQVPRLFAQSKIVLGCGTIGHCDDFWALKMRDFDAPMSGSLYMTHDNPDLYALYRVGKDLVTFRDVRDMVIKVKYYLANHIERDAISRYGKKQAEVEHTWHHRFRLILTEIQNQ